MGLSNYSEENVLTESHLQSKVRGGDKARNLYLGYHQGHSCNVGRRESWEGRSALSIHLSREHNAQVSKYLQSD